MRSQAGTDTTTTAMRAILLYIITNPVVYNRLVNEIDDAFANGEASNPIKYQETQKLTYLQACIKEGLRMHPPGGLGIPRDAPAAGLEFEGHHIPAGTWIFMTPWVNHRRPDIYGKDADYFRPERWLEDPEKSRFWDKIDTIWGSGYTTCLGKNLAIMEINKTLVAVGSKSPVAEE